MEIVLIRHAQPHWEPGGVGDDDPALTDLGREQARCAAELLGSERFDAFYVSPTRRTRDTAAPIAEALSLEPNVVPWLREIGLPPLEGQTTDEIRKYFAAARAREMDDWWAGLPGGENFRHFNERIAAGIESLLSDHHRVEIHEDPGQRFWQIPPEDPTRILIVAHAGVSAVLVSHLLGLETVPWAWLRFCVAWSGISRLRSMHFPDGCIWALETFNDTRHLSALDHADAGDGREQPHYLPHGYA
ncbi:MAG: histidine phosphatase family protein [Deltaproteobacteria bacterium]|nr:histidine phosphatase family protein [Deltaproteobacteria bacterium]MBW2420361.1 histidine phosphatase family protein [Deltaproteobacteria bacterium]